MYNWKFKIASYKWRMWLKKNQQPNLLRQKAKYVQRVCCVRIHVNFVIPSIIATANTIWLDGFLVFRNERTKQIFLSRIKSKYFIFIGSESLYYPHHQCPHNINVLSLSRFKKTKPKKKTNKQRKVSVILLEH